MTPDAQDRNPFVSIAALVVVMAAAAGLAARFELNVAVTALCVAVAIIGTWLLLSPQIETLESTLPPGGTRRGDSARGAGESATAFTAPSESAPRQRLRGEPRVAVGFDKTEGQSRPATPPARLPAIDPESPLDSAAQVRALGRLPRDAASLNVATTVAPEGNISGAFTLGQFEVRAASRRGSDHVILNDPRQDDYVVAGAAHGRYLVIVVADGDPSAENAHYGSYWSSRLLAQAIDNHLREGVPGIEKMLERTREEVVERFDRTFADGTKMRTIATGLIGLIAPTDGGPAAGFRVGGGDILVADGAGWRSVFGATAVQPEAVFPRSVEADVAPLDFDLHCLLLASDGLSHPMASNPKVSASLATGLRHVVSEVEFDQLLTFPLEEARGDRTAVGVWFTPR